MAAADAQLARQLEATLVRLRRALPSRVGPKAAHEMLASLSRSAELGTPTLALLSAATSLEDGVASGPRIAPPWSSAQCRAIATVAPKKLAHGSFLWTRPLQLPDVVVSAVADHADALAPAFGDVDFALGVAWQNVLTFRCALVVGECFDRNDASPVSDLAAAVADVHARFVGDDVVPMALWRKRGVLLARGAAAVAEDAPFQIRSVQLIEWGQQHEAVDIGDVDGVVRVVRAMGLHLDAAAMPAIVALLALIAPDDEADDVDGTLQGLSVVESELEAERGRGPRGAHARLATSRPTIERRVPRLRLRLGRRLITLRDAQNDDDDVITVVVDTLVRGSNVVV